MTQPGMQMLWSSEGFKDTQTLIELKFRLQRQFRSYPPSALDFLNNRDVFAGFLTLVDNVQLALSLRQ